MPLLINSGSCPGTGMPQELPGKGAKVVDIDVPDVDEIELVVDDGGNGKHVDYSSAGP